ncbi:MAG: peptidase [Gemmatimonadetes bacterium]|nr:peptidase [Gemmatimonadota bacterium]
MSPIKLAVFVVAIAAMPLGAQQSPTLDANQKLAREVYKEIIEINTTDSVGSVTKAVKVLEKRFRAAGFPAKDIQVLTPPDKPTKANLVVRYHGRNPQAKPIMLLAHLDVVAALRTDWTIDPFVLTEKDGYFYGRGSSDDKAMASIFVANLLRDKKEGWVPERDIILALTSDEEGGNANGVDWLIRNHKNVIDAAFALNEGGGGSLRNGTYFFNSVQAAEKVPVNLTLTATNRGGHSSVPRPDNAIYTLTDGLSKLARFRFPVMLNEVSRTFFERTAALETPDVGAAMRAIVANEKDSAAAAVISRDPRYASMLRTTCVATRLAGGHAYNALPQTASANVNCRIVPTQSTDDVVATLNRVVADTGVHITSTLDKTEKTGAKPSALVAEVMDPITAITHDMYGANIPVIPVMSTGATDGRFLRAAGIPTYGVSGLFGDPLDVRAHGRDERILVKSYFEAHEFLHRLVRQLASPKLTP